MKKLAAVFVIVTLLLNSMAPTLAHAATYLQDAQVNASTLIQDAYVAVTYYDSNNKQTLEKGWIDAIDETTFRIRSGALFGKKTIAYDKVLSVIMSEEATSRGKQINEVDRFIREMEKQKARAKETEQAAIQLLNQKTITTRPLRVRVYAPSIQKGQMVGKLIKMMQDTLVIERGRSFYQVPISSISKFDVSIKQYRNTGKGLKIGFGAGLVIYTVSYAYAKNLESREPDNIDGLAVFIFGIIAAPSALVISTLIGAMKKSDKWVEVSPQRLNLSLAPLSAVTDKAPVRTLRAGTSTKGLRAALTFSF